MALQKNIKEVESTEAGFIANAAAKNDGFLTDVIGYPMIKKRGNDYDYWFPEKSRDELGTYTYYDKTVKDLTVLNDCIVQRRLSSYGDADTYLDLSTDDQVVLNVGGVPFLTVAESGSAAIGTLGGNLALGANTISRDGAPNKGFGVDGGRIPTATANAATSGDTRTVLRLYDDTDLIEGNGAGITLHGKINDSGTYTNFGGIKVSKENGVSGDISASFYIQTRANGSNPANALRLDSSQNGYIKNKLMVGSLTETPKGQLSIFSVDEGCPALNVFNGSTAALCHNVYYDEVGPKYEKAYPASMLELSYDHVYLRTAESGSADSFVNWHHALTIARDKLGLGTADPQSALHLDASAAEDKFIQITNGVTGSGSGDGLIIGVDADGNRVIRTDGQPLNIESDLHVEGDIYSIAMTDYSNSSTVTGLSTVDFKQIYYKKIGKTVFFYYRLSGINNAPAVTFTLPLPRVNTFASHACKVLVGSTQSAGLCEASDTAYKWRIDKDFSGGGFAGTGETVLINGCGFFETA